MLTHSIMAPKRILHIHHGPRYGARHTHHGHTQDHGHAQDHGHTHHGHTQDHGHTHDKGYGSGDTGCSPFACCDLNQPYWSALGCPKGNHHAPCDDDKDMNLISTYPQSSNWLPVSNHKPPGTPSRPGLDCAEGSLDRTDPKTYYYPDGIVRDDITYLDANGTKQRRFTCDKDHHTGTCPTGSTCTHYDGSSAGLPGRQTGSATGCVASNKGAMDRQLFGRNVYLRYQDWNTAVAKTDPSGGTSWEVWPMSDDVKQAGDTADTYVATWYGENASDGTSMVLTGSVQNEVYDQWTIQVFGANRKQTLEMKSATNVHYGDDPWLTLGSYNTPWVQRTPWNGVNWKGTKSTWKVMLYPVPWVGDSLHVNQACGFNACCTFNAYLPREAPYYPHGGPDAVLCDWPDAAASKKPAAIPYSHVCPSKACCMDGCNNHGTCESYDTCTCDDGWVGTGCGTRSCLPLGKAGCNNHGTCKSDGTCTCDAGWSGQYCQTPA